MWKYRHQHAFSDADSSEDEQDRRTRSVFPYTLVDTQSALDRFCNDVEVMHSNHQCFDERAYLYLDSEGRDLGCEEGDLGLIQIGFHMMDQHLFHAEARDYTAVKFRNDLRSFRTFRVYLIDIFPVARHLTRFWRTVTNNPSIIKVMWDGKMDSAELFKNDQDINPILDLQVHEVLSRPRTYVDSRGRLRRQRDTFVECLPGLRATAARHGVWNATQRREAQQIDAVVKTMHREMRSDVWLERPMSDVMSRYAALDIYCIAALHERYRRGPADERGDGEAPCLRDDMVEGLLVKSERYCAFYKYRLRRLGDPYTSHGFLPMGVLDDVPSRSNRGAKMVTCTKCLREMEAKYFDAMYLTSEPQCPVCVRISERGTRKR